MELHNLPKTTKTAHKRLGLGHGSGRGKTSGRGTKGQKARRKIPMYFEGGALPLIKRMPFRRGKDKNYSLKGKPVIVNVSDLNKIAKDTVVDLKVLVAQRLANEKDAMKNGIKILGNGEITTALVIKGIPVTPGAKGKIEKAGGKVE